MPILNGVTHVMLISCTVILVRLSVCTPETRATTHWTVAKVSVVADTIAGVILSVLQPGERNQMISEI